MNRIASGELFKHEGHIYSVRRTGKVFKLKSEFNMFKESFCNKVSEFSEYLTVPEADELFFMVSDVEYEYLETLNGILGDLNIYDLPREQFEFTLRVYKDHFLELPEMFSTLIKTPLDLVLADPVNQGKAYSYILSKLATIMSTEIPSINNNFEGLQLDLIRTLLRIGDWLELRPVLVKATSEVEYIYLPDANKIIMHSKLRYLQGYSVVPNVYFDDPKWLEWLNLASEDIKVQLLKDPTVRYIYIIQHRDKTVTWKYTTDNIQDLHTPNKEIKTLLEEVDTVVAFKIN